MALKEKVKSLPSSPGVYLMKDSTGSIIYVGKSKNLKSRVGSYFTSSKSHTPKTLKMVKYLEDFDYIITDTEFEAFMLECNLIRSIKPIYNRKMKITRSYPYIRINLNEKYPCIEITYEHDKSDGSHYWGPYANKNTVERGINALKEFCKIPCSNGLKRNSSCLNYSLGLCIGTCLGGALAKEYSCILENIIKLLNGDNNNILENMINEMRNSAEKFDFENAAKLRDSIGVLNYLVNTARVVDFTQENQIIALLEPLNNDIIKFFLIKGNKVLFYEKYDINDLGIEKLKIILISIIQLNLDDKDHHSEVGPNEIDEAQIIYSYLKSNSNNCKYVIIPQDWINTKSNDKLKNAFDILLQ